MSCPDGNEIQGFIDRALDLAATESIAAHLESCDHCRDLVLELTRARREVTPTLESTHADGDAPLRAESVKGKTIGRYLLSRVLGVGGMGVVYAGRDPQLERDVAVKLLRPDSSVAPELRQARLLREAQAMARLSHPNVITVHEVGTHDGQVFIAMELVGGGTLSEWLRAPRTWRDIVRAFSAAGEGLSAAHAAGLVHRDFKPDNVLVRADGRFCVSDFGLARSSGESSDSGFTAAALAQTLEQPLTRTGAVVGTPAYMAPEQLSLEPADARSDQFSFCVALYEALAGTRPFVGTPEERLAAMRAFDLRKADRPLPRHIARTLERGLSYRADARWPSMEALLRALARDPLARWRRIGVATAMALLAVALVVVQHRRQAALCHGSGRELAGVWDDARRASVAAALRASGGDGAARAAQTFTSALDEYTASWTRTRQDACEATRIRGEQSEELLDRRMACLDRRLSEAGALVDVMAHGDAAALSRAAGAANALEPVTSCSAAAVMRQAKRPTDPAERARLADLERDLGRARALQIAGHPRDAVPLLSAVTDGADRAHARDLALEARYWAASAASSMGKLSESDAGLRRVGAEAIALGRDDFVVRAYSILGYELGTAQSRFDGAYLALDVAQAALQRLIDRPDLEAVYLRNRGSVLTNEGATQGKQASLDEAIADYRRAIEVVQRSGRAGGTMDAELHAALARPLTEAGRFQEAYDALTRSTVLWEKNVGSSGSMYAAAMLQLGFAAMKLHRYDEAILALRKGWEGKVAAYGADSPYSLEAATYLGVALIEAKRPAEAVQVIASSLAARPANAEAIDEVPAALVMLGRARIGVGDRTGARADLERAVAHPLFNDLDGPTRGEGELALARLLWDDPPQRPRARALGEQARVRFEKSLPAQLDPDERKEPETWLREHPLRR
jgi:tRNA A-37 threonylcarbamoyl transferase component Bud32/tetratricopeptide (TPR) repeat protein